MQNETARAIRARVSAIAAAEFYGFHPNRAGFICCPFHQGDRHPSLKLYDGGRGWHCFGCGAGGDVIDFVRRLFGLSFPQAVTRLDSDFGLGLTGQHPSRSEQAAVRQRRREEARRKAEAEEEYRKKAGEYRYWMNLSKQFAPGDDAAAGDLHPLYVEALRRMPPLECWLDEHMGR